MRLTYDYDKRKFLSSFPFCCKEQRVNIARAFYDWVRECHENHDKQVRKISILFLFFYLKMYLFFDL